MGDALRIRSGSSERMLVDLHAHYPMHLQPSERQLAHERLRQWEREWFRAHVVRLLSRLFNYQARGDEPGVTLPEMAAGDVGVILSPLYLPFDEIDFARPYGAQPRRGYFTDLLDQLRLVEEDVEKQGKGEVRARVAHSLGELTAALDCGGTCADTRRGGRVPPRTRRARSP